MKKIKLFSLLFILGIVVSVSSCKKDEDTKLDVKATLTSKTWTLTKEETSSTVKEIIDEVKVKSDMIKGATLTYNADGTFIMLIGGFPLTGTWTLGSDDKTLTLTVPDNDPDTATITSISASELVISETDEITYTDASGTSVTVSDLPVTTSWN